jgi:hypothetical protein
MTTFAHALLRVAPAIRSAWPEHKALREIMEFPHSRGLNHRTGGADPSHVGKPYPLARGVRATREFERQAHWHFIARAVIRRGPIMMRPANLVTLGTVRIAA